MSILLIMLMMSMWAMNMLMRARVHARGSAGICSGELHFHAAASD